MNSSPLIKEKIKLTQFSHGAGCGCKISPKVLDAILGPIKVQTEFPNLLVGNDTRDDAAVMDMGDGTGMISTTDFFMPIVDDPFDFGRIAAANAISDIYAMGGTPLMAIAILGWPINKLAPEVAGEVIAGGRAICQEAGIPLAGGHSIDSPEPIFGLAVSGRVKLVHLKRNEGAEPGSRLYLSKGLGVGVLSTAQKKNLLRPEHAELGKNSMIKLNALGQIISKYNFVKAITDVTGFGLLGHLSEMCSASNCSATIEFSKVPLLDQTAIVDYIQAGAVPGGTTRNWESYGHKISPISDLQRIILADPQTSGGLLIAVDEQYTKEFEDVVSSAGEQAFEIGYITERNDYLINITS